VRSGDIPLPRRDDRSDGAKFIREQIGMELDLAKSTIELEFSRLGGSIGSCIGSLKAFSDAWGEAACLDPYFSDEDQDLLVSLGMTRGW
jgi:hypothetical protein